jgi:hypothetical protein
MDELTKEGLSLNDVMVDDLQCLKYFKGDENKMNILN